MSNIYCVPSYHPKPLALSQCYKDKTTAKPPINLSVRGDRITRFAGSNCYRSLDSPASFLDSRCHYPRLGDRANSCSRNSLGNSNTLLKTTSPERNHLLNLGRPYSNYIPSVSMALKEQCILAERKSPLMSKSSKTLPVTSDISTQYCGLTYNSNFSKRKDFRNSISNCSASTLVGTERDDKIYDNKDSDINKISDSPVHTNSPNKVWFHDNPNRQSQTKMFIQSSSGTREKQLDATNHFLYRNSVKISRHEPERTSLMPNALMSTAVSAPNVYAAKKLEATESIEWEFDEFDPQYASKLDELALHLGLGGSTRPSASDPMVDKTLSELMLFDKPPLKPELRLMLVDRRSNNAPNHNLSRQRNRGSSASNFFTGIWRLISPKCKRRSRSSESAFIGRNNSSKTFSLGSCSIENDKATIDSSKAGEDGINIGNVSPNKSDRPSTNDSSLSSGGGGIRNSRTTTGRWRRWNPKSKSAENSSSSLKSAYTGNNYSVDSVSIECNQSLKVKTPSDVTSIQPELCSTNFEHSRHHGDSLTVSMPSVNNIPANNISITMTSSIITSSVTMTSAISHDDTSSFPFDSLPFDSSSKATSSSRTINSCGRGSATLSAHSTSQLSIQQASEDNNLYGDSIQRDLTPCNDTMENKLDPNNNNHHNTDNAVLPEKSKSIATSNITDSSFSNLQNIPVSEQMLCGRFSFPSSYSCSSFLLQQQQQVANNGKGSTEVQTTTPILLTPQQHSTNYLKIAVSAFGYDSLSAYCQRRQQQNHLSTSILPTTTSVEQQQAQKRAVRHSYCTSNRVHMGVHALLHPSLSVNNAIQQRRQRSNIATQLEQFPDVFAETTTSNTANLTSDCLNNSTNDGLKNVQSSYSDTQMQKRSYVKRSRLSNNKRFLSQIERGNANNDLQPSNLKKKHSSYSCSAAKERCPLIMFSVSQACPRMNYRAVLPDTSYLSASSVCNSDASYTNTNITATSTNNPGQDDKIGNTYHLNLETNAGSSNQKNGPYYLTIVSNTENLIFREICQSELDLMSYEETTNAVNNNSVMSEEVAGQIRSAIGKAKLLLTDKFVQFRDLCQRNHSFVENGEHASHHLEVLDSDLEGYWAMIELQIEDIHRLFHDVNKLRQNNWQLPVLHPVVNSTPRKSRKLRLGIKSHNNINPTVISNAAKQRLKDAKARFQNQIFEKGEY